MEGLSTFQFVNAGSSSWLGTRLVQIVCRRPRFLIHPLLPSSDRRNRAAGEQSLPSEGHSSIQIRGDRKNRGPLTMASPRPSQQPQFRECGLDDERSRPDRIHPRPVSLRLWSIKFWTTGFLSNSLLRAPNAAPLSDVTQLCARGAYPYLAPTYHNVGANGHQVVVPSGAPQASGYHTHNAVLTLARACATYSGRCCWMLQAAGHSSTPAWQLHSPRTSSYMIPHAFQLVFQLQSSTASAGICCR